MIFWKTIKQELKNGSTVGLLYTLQSKGSSPGRQGFKMLVSASGLLLGSIGGGIMEYDLVEKTKLTIQKVAAPSKYRLAHRKGEDASGLICSGEQTVAMYVLAQKDIYWLEVLIENEEKGLLVLTESNVAFVLNQSLAQRFEYKISSDTWLVKEDLAYRNVLHIVGGGHVGLALSKLGSALGFQVKVYDNRKNLNTFQNNPFAKVIAVPSFQEIGQYIPEGEKHFVVIMSFMFDTDKLILTKLLPKNYKYIGMMGSRKKVKTLLKQLQEEGFAQAEIQKLHSPIGVQISSQTPAEIAISILAELIRVKNGV